MRTEKMRMRLGRIAARGDDRFRWLAFFDPCFEHGQLVELIRARTAGAVTYAWQHEQTIEITWIAGRRLDSLEVMHASERRNRGIVPAVVLQELAATRLESG